MTDVHAPLKTAPLTNRSAITNGTVLLEGVDGRSREGRRYRDLLDAFIAEFGAATEAEIALCRRAARLSTHLEQEDAQAIRGEVSDVAASVTATNALRRVLSDLRTSQKVRRRTQRISGATA